MRLHGDWDYRLDATGRAWLAYYDKDRLLRLRDPDGKEQALGLEGRPQAPSGIALGTMSTGVAALWRDKLPQKGLYLLDSNRLSAPAQELGGDSEPLARFRIVTGGNDLLHLFWLGEKLQSQGGDKYNIYYRSWDRRDQSLSPLVRLVSGMYPVAATDAAGGVMAYSWLLNEEPKRIVVRYRPADAPRDGASGGFQDPVTVAEVPSMTPIFEAFQSGARSFVVWLGQDPADGEYQLSGAYSDDQGRSWQRFAFEDLHKYDIGSLQAIADADGHILIAVTARIRTSPDIRQDVYLIRSADRGKTWSKAESLRRDAGQPAGRSEEPDALKRFHARNAALAFGDKPGQVLVVWEDWRDIRSGLYASLSEDFGQTWTLGNVPLSRDATENLALSPAPNPLYFAGGRYHLIAEQATDDGFKTQTLVRLDLSADDLANQAKALSSSRPDPAAREAALRKREEAFWQAMVAGDYAKTYDYLDPFFRSQVARDNYLTHMGKIKYSQATVEKVEIDGPIAQVTTKIRASAPGFKAPSTGETISQAEREVSVTNTWLSLDGDWFREFRIESQEKVFTRY